MPKITFKKAFFRIFWKILAKTGPQSLYLCGFPEARVEMEVAPFRALTLFSGTPVQHLILCRNGGRPFQGIDTQIRQNTQSETPRRRNGGRPFQGIDTVNYMQPLLMNIMM